MGGVDEGGGGGGWGGKGRPIDSSDFHDEAFVGGWMLRESRLINFTIINTEHLLECFERRAATENFISS